MDLIKWVNYIVLILLGLSLPFIAYRLNEGYEEDLYIQQHRPLTKMAIVDRVKGLGTMRAPNKIYLRYRGKRYTVDISNTYFKNTANTDSLFVHYDPVANKVVQAYSKPKRHTALLVLITLGGLVIVVGQLVDLRNQLNKRQSQL